MVRYEKGHKEVTRDHILKVASRRFRQDGIDSVGLASLMAEAGLTHGGFYNHFASKEDLVAAAVRRAMEERLAGLKARANADIEWIVRSYLDPRHRDAPAKGCAIASLGGEVARRPETTRQVLGGGIEALIAEIAARLPEGVAQAEREKRAFAILSLMLGTLQLARLATDAEQSARILNGGIAAALELAGVGTAPKPD